jgi:hypothetical protein
VFRRQFETVAKHNYWTPPEKATYLIAGYPHSTWRPYWSDVRRETEALDNRYSDHHLEAAFHSQLKRRTQLVGESLQEFADAIVHLAHRAHVKPPYGNHILMETLALTSRSLAGGPARLRSL